MNQTLNGVTHKAVVYGQPHVCECGRVLHNGRTKFFMTLNFDNGRARELFLHMDEAGSTLDGMADCIGILISMLLKQGVQIEDVAEKLSWQRFDPQGRTDNKDPELRSCNSVIDYAVRWAKGMKCVNKTKQAKLDGVNVGDGEDRAQPALIRRCNGCHRVTAIDVEDTPEHRRQMEMHGQTVEVVTRRKADMHWFEGGPCVCGMNKEVSVERQK
jgi:hypothetical protein